MSSEALMDLEEAVAAFETLVRRRQSPSRYDARRLLIALGSVLEQGEDSLPGLLLKRLQAVCERASDAWELAVAQEMELACAEHVAGTDPRYLDHPRFDFTYLLEARRRLELRFLGLRRLGLEMEHPWLERVAEADALLAPYLGEDGEPPAEGLSED
jgi:hypothetical protein